MQNTLVAFGILQHTNSPFLLGITTSVTFIPFLLGLVSGAIIDSWSRRKLILLINGLQVIPIVSLALAFSQNHFVFWIVVVIVIVNGSLVAITWPAQYALIGDIVDAKDITNATSFQLAFQYVGGLTGSALVGLFANRLGISGLLFLNCAFILAAVAFIAIMGEPASVLKNSVKENETSASSIISNIKEGLRYSWNAKVVFGGEMIYFIANLFMWPSVTTLVPVFSRNVLGLGASGLGWLTTAYSFGSLAGNLVLASKNRGRKGRLLFASSIGWGLSFILLSSWAFFPFSLVALFTMGVVLSLVMSLASIILLSNASPEVRGRVMGIQTLFISSAGVGNLVAGSLAQSFGGVVALDTEGGVFIASIFALMVIVPSLRRAE